MRIHLWNTVFSLLFVGLVGFGTAWLVSAGKLFYEIPVRDLALIALAVFRLVRLATYDVITQFIRDWFAGAKPDSFAHTLGALLGCPWCTGLWFGFVVVFSYFAFTIYAWLPILVLAMAALASFLQLAANALGWTAEVRKQQALGAKSS